MDRLVSECDIVYHLAAAVAIALAVEIQAHARTQIGDCLFLSGHVENGLPLFDADANYHYPAVVPTPKVTPKSTVDMIANSFSGAIVHHYLADIAQMTHGSQRHVGQCQFHELPFTSPQPTAFSGQQS